MSNLREAAQQALDWLYGNDILHPTKVSQDLRAALEQDESEGSVCIRCGALAFDPLAPQQAEPEPVAWMVVVDGGTSAYVTDNPTDFVMDNPDYPESAYRALPLYTAPPQRKPLTDAEIQELSQQHKFDSRMEKFVRVIERAHGIGEEV